MLINKLKTMTLEAYIDSFSDNPEAIFQDIQEIVGAIEKQEIIDTFDSFSIDAFPQSMGKAPENLSNSEMFDLLLTESTKNAGKYFSVSEAWAYAVLSSHFSEYLMEQIYVIYHYNLNQKKLDEIIKNKLYEWYETSNQQNIIRVSGKRPEFIQYPVDKISQNLFCYLESGTYSMSAEKSGSKDELTTIVTLDFEELKKNKALADIIDRILTPFDKRVYVAAGTLQQAGNKYISATQIYKQMGGKGSPAAKHISKIIESCTKMMGIRLSIDNQEEAAKYNYREFQRGLFYLFPVKIIENIAINGRTTDFCIQFLDELTLFAFAKQRKQITEYTPEQWSLPFSMTDDNILLDDYFRSRTARMRRDKARSKNHSYNGKMLYSKIYENCGIDTQNKRTRVTGKIRKLLNHYKATGIIVDYQEGKDGITIEV